MGKNERAADPTTAFRVPSGLAALTDIDPSGTPIGPQDKAAAADALADLGPELAGLQERLYAAATGGSEQRAVLLVLQGMDTSGKDGVVDKVLGLMNPAGLHLASFKKPTPEELAHDFLWRIEKQVPGPGAVGVFNRSQYEDVLVVRVHDLVPSAVWEPRYQQINDFEQRLVDSGVTVVKCFLHISKQVQKERLLARLDDPTKFWKYNPGDVDERGYWDAYQAAYLDALNRCSTEAAPWHVIPSDRKWYRNWAIAALLHRTLADLDPQYPPAEFDVEVEKKRVQGS